MIKKIPFSPPDITDREINNVVEVLKSGWITTGPKVKEFEERIKSYCGVKNVILLNSATAGLFLSLKALGIGEGDEVITTPYTFAATSNVVLHCGAKPVFVDIGEDFNISVKNIEKAINSRTKAIISVDFGGFPVDYQEILDLCRKYNITYISDSAHSFGAIYNGNKIGTIPDFTVFSFHAVKNLTTAEGGAIVFNSDDEDLYRKLKLLSLHGQSKDAFEKYATTNSWYYEIQEVGYKFNMTDIQAALGIAQFDRYESEILPRRKAIFNIYNEILKNENLILPPQKTESKETSYHIYALRIKNIDEKVRNEVIKIMSDKGISLNVHYIPVVMHPVYKKMGYDIKDYPKSYETYISELSLPVYSQMKDSDAEYVASCLLKTLSILKIV
ncbi:MAG: DegT/DnrJ/EryC1/StrS family aminotransferase [Brevinematales bacterium]|nr:DegT/DnrJ/EryC1/StrS family aminotransferase [Brevinematales bacterium]